MNSPTKIVVIHDGLIGKDDPLLVTLRMKFEDENVIYRENSNVGLEYVLGNINQKMIVVLDIGFNKGELSGWEVFRSIREQTSLVYVILVTADELIKINPENLKFLINHDAFALEDVTADYSRIVSLVEKASHKLNARVDAVLEDWINNHSKEEIEKPYLTSDGKTYSLKDLQLEIRKDTEFGREIERKILRLTIDLLTRGKKSIND